MYQEFYRGSDLLHLPLFAFILFMVVFCAVVTWLFILRRGDRKFDELAQIPFAAERSQRIEK